MKLLFDQNLSRQLPRLLSDRYPESIHIREVGMRGAPDRGIWAYARENGFIIVTKDTDYRVLSRNLGHPPKVVLITLGNGPTAEVETLLRENYAAVAALEWNEWQGLLELPG